MTHSLADTPYRAASLHILVEQTRAVAKIAGGNADALDREGVFPVDEVHELHRAGLLHAPFPASIGGCDLGFVPTDPIILADVLAALGQGSLALGRLYEGHINAVKLVRLYGSPENLRLLKTEADAGRLTGVWMAEDENPLALELWGSVRKLQGRKILASGAGHIQRPLIAAKTETGSLLLLPNLPEGRADTSSWTAAGMKASATGTVDFTGVCVGTDEVVGQPGDYMRSPYFRGGAWRVMAVQLGGVQALLEAYRRQLTASARDVDRIQRVRFGEAVAVAETARLWVREAAMRAEDIEGNPAAIDAYVDLMRGAFEGAALRIVALAEKSLGLKAFLRPNPVERIARDLTTYLRQPALDASQEAAAAFFFHQPGPGEVM